MENFDTSSIISGEGKILFVFGKVKRVDVLGREVHDYIGVDLESNKVDSLESSYLIEKKYIDDLTLKQQLKVADLIKLKSDLQGNILAITGKARSGKDTVASLISEKKEYIITSLADPIRAIADIIDGETKGKNRERLIMVGQGLREIDKHIWLKTWLRSALEDIETYGFVTPFIVTDVRQPNEYYFFKSLGAKIIRVKPVHENYRLSIIKNKDGEEDLNKELLDDETETYTDTFEVDFEVINEYNMDRLSEKVTNLLKLIN